MQNDLIEWKSKYSHSTTGKVGSGYRSGFMKRNRHLIKWKKGEKYELNRASWNTYDNSMQMYVQVYDVMVDAGLAVKLAASQWENIEGDVVDKGNVFGCMVTHDLTHPEMCIVMDEVDGNTNMKVDGNHGGELSVCAKDKNSQQRQVQKINTSPCLD